MSSVAIVAIPAQSSWVRNVSSEKVPHLTLLYLGEEPLGTNSQQILEYVEHASSLLKVFWLPIDRRGKLGPKKADVLFFNKDYSSIADFRDHLLSNDRIHALYSSVEQYDEWTPHLTLGFPESPAHSSPVLDEGVVFDSIAVWTGEYSGPSFKLKLMPEMETFMSDLQHYGVKGMRWGVRRNPDRSTGTPGVIRGHKSSDGTPMVIRKKTNEGHPEAPDSLRAREFKNRAKKFGPSALNNDELQALVQRMNLEKQYSQLQPPTAGKKTQKFVADFLISAGKQQASKAVNDQLSKIIMAKLKK
jgi:hypothetical protein